MKSRERARELARESSSTGAAGLDVSPPAGRAQRVAHCGTTRFLILRGGHFRELCLPPPPPPPHRLGPQRSFPCVPLKFFSLWRLLASGVAGPGSSVKNGHRLHAGGLHAQAQPPRTQTRVALRRPLLRPDGRLAAAGARPCRCRVRTSHASQTLHFLRPRSSRLRLSPPKPHFTAAAALRPGAAQK